MRNVAKWVFVGVVVICGIAIIAYALKGCKKSVDKSEGNRFVDSVVAQAIISNSKAKKALDSLKSVAIYQTKRGDSLQKDLNLIKGSLKGKDKDIAALVEEINAAEVGKDTSLIIRSCDSLKWLYPIAKGLVTEYIIKNDSLIAVNAKIITEKDTIISRLNGMFSETNSTLFEISRQYSNLSADYKKQLKKAAKRWGLGPELTATWLNGKMTIAPGIGLHYSLLKF